MKKKPLIDRINAEISHGKKLYWVLLDPDHFTPAQGVATAKAAQTCGVSGLLIGGSLIQNGRFDAFVKLIKKAVTIPVIIFPGDSSQLSPHADAVLYLSLVSGRNPVNLIGEHVKAAPLIRHYKIEPISTAYMLIESGAVTSVEFMSNTRPLPRTKPAIAAAHALAAQYMGMRMVYLEAGSGAPQCVPDEMVRMVRSSVEIPLIVGGGIRDVETAHAKIVAGADIIVTGNLLQKKEGRIVMKDIARMVAMYGRSRKK